MLKRVPSIQTETRFLRDRHCHNGSQCIHDLDEASYFVCTHRSEISQKCTNLTGIIGEDIRTAWPFHEVFHTLVKRFHTKGKLCSAKVDDFSVITQVSSTRVQYDGCKPELEGGKML